MKSTRARFGRLAAGGAALALMLGACGDDSPASSDSTEAPDTTSEDTEAPGTTDAPARDDGRSGDGRTDDRGSDHRAAHHGATEHRHADAADDPAAHDRRADSRGRAGVLRRLRRRHERVGPRGARRRVRHRRDRRWVPHVQRRAPRSSTRSRRGRSATPVVVWPSLLDAGGRVVTDSASRDPARDDPWRVGRDSPAGSIRRTRTSASTPSRSRAPASSRSTKYRPGRGVRQPRWPCRRRPERLRAGAPRRSGVRVRPRDALRA